MKKKNDLFLILALCLAAACSIGLYMNTSGILFSPIADSLNEKRGSVAVFYTIMTFSSAIFSTIIPAFSTNKNFRKIYICGIIGAVCSLILMANAAGLIMLYIGGLFLGASFSTYFMVVLTTIINCSFEENTGTITGFVFSFSGVAGAIFSPVLSAVVNTYGWRMGFYVMAGLTVILCLPGVFAKMKIEREKKDDLSAQTDFNYLSAGFILLIMMSVCYLFIPALPQHFPGLALSKNFDETIGPLLVSASMIGNIVFKLIAGVLADRLGSIKALFVMSVITLAGIVLMFFAGSATLALAAAFLIGAIFSITAVLGAYHTRELFGNDSYKKAYSIVSLAGNTSNALSIAAVGYIYDFFSSYDPALILAMILDVVAFALALFAEKTVNKHK